MAHPGVVADTDVVIDFLRGRGAGAPVVRGLLREGRMLLTAITAFELAAGALQEADQAAVEALCEGRVVSLGAGAAAKAGEVARTLRSAGTPIGVADTLIAGLCLHHGFALATCDHRHFSRVPGLTLHESE